MTPTDNTFILTVDCPDTIGIVAAVAGFLRDQGFFVEESSHFGDRDTGRFFMRTVFTPQRADFSRPGFEQGFEPIALQFNMKWHVYDTKVRPRVLIMASRHEHCVNDLLHRYRTGALAMEIPAIISNHPDLASLAEWHRVPFFHVPVTPESKPQAEARMLEIIEDTQAELVILARYMQVLSRDICEKLSGRIINIHHSFLPGFKGAHPYQKAHAHGVKLIGATAHYVTAELDEGPIIEQGVERVDHSHSPAELAAVGRDIESLTLARAVKLHIDRRVLLNGRKTVILR
ncbi:MAG: formyltetrahydrofolate deformylase [Gammaproteobacteria bacterium]